MLKRLLPSSLMPLAIAAVLALSVHAHAQTRVALVVGNSAYKNVVNLGNPAHDAQDVSAALKRLGFTVKTVIDADFDGFRRALLEFGRLAPSADMAVFYFAGHGVEINGNNWLLPTDVELKNDVDASTEAIGLQSAMQAVATTKTLGLVILDACRNNPFQSTMRRSVPTRSVQMYGLAPVEPADNVLVAYAARDGTVANDGAGRNSPYTTALLKHIETPGLELDFLFRNIRDDVMAATSNEQQPFVYGSLSSDEIYLKAPPAGMVAGDPMPPPDAAEIAWSFLRATNDASTLSRFVDRFPQSPHISDAKVRIASLATAPAPGVTTDAPPPIVVAFADTEFEQVEKAVARRFVRDAPAVEQAWDLIKETKDHKVIRHFVEQFPNKKRRVAADTHLASLGQKPITPKLVLAPPPRLDVDELVFAQAAADPDVLECFRAGDQMAPACDRAVGRFPDISRFVEDVHFTIGLCQALGNPKGCVPSVPIMWNFPQKPAGDASNTATTATPSGIVESGNGNAGGNNGGGAGNNVGGGNEGGGNGGGGGVATPAAGDNDHERHDRRAMNGNHNRGARNLAALRSKFTSIKSGLPTSNSKTTNIKAEGLGTAKFTSVKTGGLATANSKVTDVKTGGLATANPKVTSVVTGAVPKTPNVPSAAVKTPDLKVNVKIPEVKFNMRVPDIRVPVPGH